MKFNLKKDDINRKVDEVLYMNPATLSPNALSSAIMDDGSRYFALVYLTERIFSHYDACYEIENPQNGESDLISFVSKSSKVLLKMPKNPDLNFGFDSYDFGIIIDSEISFAQRKDLSEVFKTAAHCDSSPIDMIIVKLICDALI
ncbi:hypothetical protein [Methanobrevibacter sp.]|uniref:hypothetical protein n=1 Tax=Methanobrevibacter sp. TaxID=66852 RepID=UPI003890C906